MSDQYIRLDELLSEPNRLGVMADLIQHGGATSFVELAKRQRFQNYGTLSKHNEKLERAGYIELRKDTVAGTKATRTRLQIKA